MLKRVVSKKGQRWLFFLLVVNFFFVATLFPAEGAAVVTYKLTVVALPAVGGKVTSTPAAINCGQGAIRCTASYVQGSPSNTLQLTATPARGYKFTSWSGCTADPGFPDKCTVTVNANKNVRANFSKLKIYTLNVVAAPTIGGSVTSNPAGLDCGLLAGKCKMLFTEGGSNTVDLYATSVKTGKFKFSGWTGCTADPATPNKCSLTVNATKSVTAKFVSATGKTISGRVTLNGASLRGVTVNLAGTSTSVTATDGKGNYVFSGLTSGSYVLAPSSASYGFTPTTQDISITGANILAANFIAGALPPGATRPTTGDAQSVTDASATLVGDFTNPGGFSTDAWFEWGTTTSYGNSTYKLNYATSGNKTPSINIAALSAATTYHYRVATSNTDGTWYGTDKTFTTLPQIAGATNPVTYNAGNVTNTSATLAGYFYGPTGLTTEVWFEWGLTAAYGNTTSSSFYSYPGYIGVSGKISGLTVGTTYHYRFGTKNGNGTWYGADMTFTTIPLSAPVNVSKGLTHPIQFAVDANYVYWTEQGDGLAVPVVPATVKMMPLAGCGLLTPATPVTPCPLILADVAVSLLTDPSGIAVDATYVYFTDFTAGSVNMVPIPATPFIGLGCGVACPAVPTVLVTGLLGHPQDIVVGATNVYYTEFGSWGPGMRNADGTVNLLPIAPFVAVTPCTLAPVVPVPPSVACPLPTVMASGLDGPASLKIDATNAYWTEVANFVGGAGSIKQVAIAPFVVVATPCTIPPAVPVFPSVACPLPTALVTGLTGSKNIAIDATDVYFWSGYGTLSSVPIGGPTAGNPIVEVMSGQNGTQPMAIDVNNIYWTENISAGYLKKIDKVTGNVTVLVSGLKTGLTPGAGNGALGILTDSPSATGNVYWMLSDTFNGTTMSWASVGEINKVTK